MFDKMVGQQAEKDDPRHRIVDLRRESSSLVVSNFYATDLFPLVLANRPIDLKSLSAS